MRNKIIFSIVDNQGVKQLYLHKIVKKIIAYCALVLFSLIAGGFFLMTYLMEEVREINANKMQMIDKYRSVYFQNLAFKEQINARSLELIEMSKKVDDLEEIIDFSKNKEQSTDDVHIMSPDAKEQIFLLQIIPNGHPLKEFSKIVSIAQRLHPLKNRYGLDSGIDYIVPSNTPVYATADGIIELARLRSSFGGYGRFVKITHAYGFTSVYAHLSKVAVQKGGFVKKGDLIGYTGRSGASSGERLYYEVRFLGSYQDALAFAQWDKEHFESIFEKAKYVDWNKLFWAIEDLKRLQAYQEVQN